MSLKSLLKNVARCENNRQPGNIEGLSCALALLDARTSNMDHEQLCCNTSNVVLKFVF